MVDIDLFFSHDAKLMMPAHSVHVDDRHSEKCCDHSKPCVRSHPSSFQCQCGLSCLVVLINQGATFAQKMCDVGSQNHLAIDVAPLIFKLGLALVWRWCCLSTRGNEATCPFLRPGMSCGDDLDRADNRRRNHPISSRSFAMSCCQCCVQNFHLERSSCCASQ